MMLSIFLVDANCFWVFVSQVYRKLVVFIHGYLKDTWI